MKAVFLVLLSIFVLATLFILIAGVIVMGAGGGKKTAMWSNRLMVARVCMQAAAIAMLFLLFLVS